MDSRIILETYKRYLRTLNCSDAELFTNYKKLMDFNKENCDDKELETLIMFDCIGKNLNEIRKRGIRAKDYSNGNWDVEAVKRGCRLIDDIKKLSDLHDRDAYIASSRNFWELADKQSPYVQLFLYLCFADRLSLNRLFEVSIKELEEVAQKASEEKQRNGITN